MRAYINWIQKTPRKKQGVLVEFHPIDFDTPIGFYKMEMGYRSTLEERCRAHGIPLKELKDV